MMETSGFSAQFKKFERTAEIAVSYVNGWSRMNHERGCFPYQCE